jgi:hypothetical protein
MLDLRRVNFSPRKKALPASESVMKCINRIDHIEALTVRGMGYYVDHPDEGAAGRRRAGIVLCSFLSTK